MLLGCIADDFTGASDLANTLAKGGMRTVQFVGIPDSPADPACEAGVVALKSRSIPQELAVQQSVEALEWLRAQGCRQYVFKYCSTFDSTPEGNIGPVALALAKRLSAKGVVVCPAFPTAGRTLYQGHLFVADRLLSESGMQNHPLTPMTDPDIRRWLHVQTGSTIGHVPWPIVARGPQAIRRALDDSAGCDQMLTIVDAITDDDLLAIGAACDGAKLVTGGSGIATGLPANFARAGLLAAEGSPFETSTGPAAVIAGSCSAATREQISCYAKSHPAFAINIDRLMRGETSAEDIADAMLAQIEAKPICYSTAEVTQVRAIQERYGRERTAAAIEHLFGRLAIRLNDRSVTRLVVAGGETSGAVVGALGLRELAIGPEIDPGVPALSARRNGVLALALKSGNFGGPDFFEKAVRALEGRS